MTRRIEKFRPIEPGKAGVYICGPTVYDYAHLGHARTYINSDVLLRALEWLDFKVKSVMNITDVGHLTSDADSGEDKLEKKARQEKRKILELAKFYEADFWRMVESLNIKRPNKVTKATDYINEMMKLVLILEKKGYTYLIDDGVYFDTSKFKDYGRLARLDLHGLREGARVKLNKQKRNPTDFALWKLAKKEDHRQLEWDSPWGRHSFPGWHIECSAMSMAELGESFDIHTGGVDHIPVHHTNEIAQSEAATGKKFVRYWFHSGFLLIDGEKMSKSLGNFLRVKDLIDKSFDPLSLRYLFLSAHYRKTMNFSLQALKAASDGYKRLRSMVSQWQGVKGRTKLSEEKLLKVQELSLKFKTAVENDLNMPQAIAVVWEMAKSNIPEYDKYELILDWDRVLGLKLAEPGKEKEQISDEVKKLAEERLVQRKKGKFRTADRLRRKIKSLGYEIEDKEDGYFLKEEEI